MAIGHGDAGFDAMRADGAREPIEIHALLRVGGDLDDFHAERGGGSENAEVRGAFHRDDVAGFGHGAEAQIDGLQGTAGDHDVIWRKLATGVRGAARNLPPQRLDARREFVVRAMERLPVHDAAHDEIYGAVGEKLRAGTARGEGDGGRIAPDRADGGEDLVRTREVRLRAGAVDAGFGDQAGERAPAQRKPDLGRASR